MSEPVLVGLIFADKIITEDNGKKGIIGTFSRFMAQGFPAIFPPWAIYAAVTNLEGKHRFTISLCPDEEDTSLIPISGELDSKNRSDVIEIAPTIIGLPFPKAGRYNLTFEIDDYPIGARILHVEQKPA